MKQANNFKWLIGYIIILLLQTACGIKKAVKFIPDISHYNHIQPQIQVISDTLSITEKNYLIKNRTGHWQLKVAGDPYQIGLKYGILAKDLISFQDSVFFEKIKTIVKEERRIRLINTFLKFYNRNLYKNVPGEYLAEIYGLSAHADTSYNQFATPFLKSLYLHAAHDIGHALQDLMLVGCSSMAVWDEKSEDGQLLIGRNFDFYAGDDFAKNKLISFITPDQGYSYMSVAWPGMIGVVSGMNVKGLTATINAGKSKIPLSAKTPISILVREIIQYASTIDEAIEIAKKRKVFVSESIMIGSAIDNRSVIIEVSPHKMGVYEVKNENKLICSNHFQSNEYLKDKKNSKWKEESHSVYRYQKMEELLAKKDQLNVPKMVELLRETNGLNNTKIGYGNEKALNQLLAHHSIVFKPASKMVWVSSNPYQLGEFVAYDLNKIFAENDSNVVILETDSLNIPAAEFIHSTDFKKYEQYRKVNELITISLKNGANLSPVVLDEYVQLNPDFWKVYAQVGTYYYQKKEYAQAVNYLEQALTKEITTIPDKELVQKQLKKAKNNIK